jgi:hypothetical protein
MGLLSLSLYYNSEIREKRQLRYSTNHILTAEELKTGWLFPRHSRHQCRSSGCLRISPGGLENGRIIGRKERVIGGPILSGLWGDPDYRSPDYGRTNVRVI